MNDLIATAVAQDLLDVAGAAADDQRGLVGGIRRQATCDLAAVGRDYADGVAAAERAVDSGNAGRQQAAPTRERALGAGVHAQRALRLQRARDPLLARGARCGARQEPRRLAALQQGAERP